MFLSIEICIIRNNYPLSAGSIGAISMHTLIFSFDHHFIYNEFRYYTAERFNFLNMMTTYEIVGLNYYKVKSPITGENDVSFITRKLFIDKGISISQLVT
jgi:hypothetical protein